MADEDKLKDLKKLSPNERLEKLKELQEKDREEIEKAQKLLQETEDEIGRERELEKIPIPQLKAVDIGALFSTEEKELFKAKRFTAAPAKEKEEKPEEPRRAEEREELERIAEQAPRLSQEEEAAQAQYLDQLSQKPVEDIYNRVKDIYQQVKATGEITPEQMNELNNVSYANRRKMEDIQSGRYTEVTQEAAREMVLTEKMKNWLQDSYGRRAA
ncbi:hypothetical protein KY343_03845 [Candidatus Woesearchaeota archaeon]|nr:hypothetical protein [Candidatus Woesearchaeota archaeon]